MSNDIDISSSWPVVKLADITTAIQYGYTTSAAEKPVGPRFLRITDIQDNRVDWNTVPFCKVEAKDKSKYLLKQGDIVFARTGATVGKSFLIKEKIPESIFASYLIRVRLKSEIEARYIDYFFKSSQYWKQISESQAGIGQPNVNGTKLAQLQIPLAPRNVQKFIVAEIEKQFSRLDEAVANLKRVKANLKRYKAAVLKAAVEGKLTEEWRVAHPDVEPASEIIKQSLAERKKKWEEAELEKMKTRRTKPKDDKWREKYKEPTELDISSLPELPQGWLWVSLETVTDAIGGYAFESKKFSDSGYLIVKMANIKMGKIDLSQQPSFISDVDSEVAKKYSLIPGDILVTLTGTRKKRDYGYIAVVKDNKRILLNQRIVRLRPYSSILPKYIEIAMQNEVYRNRFFSYETGNVGQGNVGMGAVTKEPIALPPSEEQKTMVAEIERYFSVAEEIEGVINANLARAERLRQSILSRVFSG